MTGAVQDAFVDQYIAKASLERQRLIESLSSAKEWQDRLLTDLLKQNSDTDFGRKHGFGRIRNLADFRHAVPIGDYATMRPWIERSAAGEKGVLSADDPVVFFKTSGSTGTNKVIPVTPSFMRTSFFPFYYAAIGNLFEHFPELGTRSGATLNLRYDAAGAAGTTTAGHPHLGASQVDFGRMFGELTATEPGSRAPWAALPIDTRHMTELEKAYVRLRSAVEHDIECVVGINPAAVSALPHQLACWLPAMIKDLFDGTIAGRPGYTANKRRARQLERIAGYYPKALPCYVWPNIKVLYCWTAGLASLYVPRLRESFGPDVSVLPAPTAASEAPVGLALDRHATAGSLVTSAVVYEFIGADEDIRPDSSTVDFSKLEPGQEYHVIVSHIGGLYRYALGDVVRVIDSSHGVPRVEYAGRNTLSNCAGERLRESHIVQALHSALSSSGMEICNVACKVAPADESSGRRPSYAVLIAPRRTPSVSETGLLEARLDALVGKACSGYRDARAAGKLAALSLHLTTPEAFFNEWQWRVSNGIRIAQAKDRLFVSGEDWARILANDFPVDSTSVQLAS